MTSRKMTTCLLVLLLLLTVNLASSTIEENYNSDTNLLPRMSESTHTESGYKAHIIVNPQTAGTYVKENGYNLDLTINQKGIGGRLAETGYQLDLIPEKTFPDFLDLTITNVTLSKNIIGQGFLCKINTTASNNGLYYATFYVILNANATTIGTQIITLTTKNYQTITFTWNTTGFAHGNYTMSATASTVPGEIDTENNTVVDGTVLVTVPGDIDGDLDVDYDDFIVLAGAYGSSSGQEAYKPGADFDDDGYVDYDDFIILAGNYGKTSV